MVTMYSWSKPEPKVIQSSHKSSSDKIISKMYKMLVSVHTSFNASGYNKQMLKTKNTEVIQKKLLVK